MSQLNKLYRNFIILQEDERGYSISNDKTLSGYSKVEAKGEKCKISFYAQNLRSDSDDYCILAICSKKDSKQLVNLGQVTILDEGKLEVSKEYFLDDVGGIGLSFDKVTGAAVAKMRSDIPIIVMHGFVNGEEPTDNWKNYKVVNAANAKTKETVEFLKKDDKKRDKKDKDKDKEKSYHKNKEKNEEKMNHMQEEKACVKEEVKVKHMEKEEEEKVCSKEEIKVKIKVEEEKKECSENKVKHEEHEMKQDCNKEKNNHANKKEDCGCNEKEYKIKHMHEKEKKYCNEDEYNMKYTCQKGKRENPFDEETYNSNPFGETVYKEAPNNFELDENSTRKSNKFNDYENKIEELSGNFKIRGTVGEYFEGIASGFEVLSNEYREIKNCKWYRVPVKDLDDLCNMSNYNRYTVAYYPMLNYYPYIRKHGYFNLGFKCDKNGNLKYIVYAIPGNRSLDDQPYEGKTGFVTWVNRENRNGVGCWLMFYDFRNSTVVVPME